MSLNRTNIYLSVHLV